MKDWKVRYKRYFALVEELIDDNATVLIVGANDGGHRIGDPTQAVWRSTWKGYFIEPDPDARKALEKNWPGVKILPYAVAEGESVITLYKIKEEYRRQFYDIRKNDGSCITSCDRAYVERWVKKLFPGVPVENVITTFIAEAITLASLSIKPALVQIDIEGLDHVAALQALDCFDAAILLYEHQHIKEKAALVNKRAKEKGYVVEKLKHDTILWRTV